MNNDGNAQNATYNNQQGSPTRRTRSHVDIASHETQNGEAVERDIVPQDSISNAPSRNVTSVTQKANGSTRITSERKTERTRVSAKHHIRTRYKSPPKETTAGALDAEESKGSQPPRVSSRAVARIPTSPRKNKKVLPPWKPQVSIIAHTTAPLACRTSIPPLSHHLPQSLEPRSLNLLSAKEQEAAILDDLLFVLMGYEGQYIRYHESYNPSVEEERLAGPSYKILPGLDPSLQDLTRSVLKLATNYSAMEAFVEVLGRHEYGATNHALAASIRKSFKDYLILIAQLEHQLISNPSFTLHLLHLHTLPTNHIMSQLYTLAQEILRRNALLNAEDEDEELAESAETYDDVRDIIDHLNKDGGLDTGSTGQKYCKGGRILRLLTERLSLMSGDPQARTLLQTLLRDASRPYMSMLNEWLHKGGINDPHGEFLIREQTSINRAILENDYTDAYWEKRYTIREKEVPPQLEGVKAKVLLAGKYLNVVRECGGVDVSKEIRDVPKTFDDARFLENVNGAYAHANSSLLNLLLTTHGLSDRLRSLKHYFFLDRSDFLTHFVDLSASELKRPWRQVNIGKLQSLLDLVLRQPGSVAAQDPFKEDVKVEMSRATLTEFLVRVISVQGFETDVPNPSLEEFLAPGVQFSFGDNDAMTGLESLQWKYSVPFPLSLVIRGNTVLRYQVIFRYLLSLRVLEGQLVNCWRDHQKVISWTHRSKNPRLQTLKGRAWRLRAHMLAFVQQITYYCTSQVIEPLWKALMHRVDDTSDQTEANDSPRVARTVDGLMKDHIDFLDNCLKECMLMNSRLVKMQSKISSICQMFTVWTTTTFTRHLCAADPTLAGSAPALAYLSSQYPLPRNPVPAVFKTYDPQRVSKLDGLLSQYEYLFHHHLQKLITGLDYFAATETMALSRLCAQLSTSLDESKAVKMRGGAPVGGQGGGTGHRGAGHRRAKREREDAEDDDDNNDNNDDTNEDDEDEEEEEDDGMGELGNGLGDEMGG